MTMDFVEFHARSAFSFLEGASLPEVMAEACADRQLPAMALLDRDGVYGAPRFHLHAKKCGVKAHIGSEISIQPLAISVQAKLLPQRTQRHEKETKGHSTPPAAAGFARDDKSKIKDFLETRNEKLK